MKAAARIAALFVILIALCALVLRLHAANPVADVKDAGFTNATCTTFTGSFTPTNGGDTWMMVCGTSSSATAPFPILASDNNGGAWITQGNVNTTTGVATIFSSFNHPSGATTITVVDNAGSGTCGQSCLVYEFGGLFSPILDKVVVSTSAGSGSTWSTGSTGTLSQPNELAIAVFDAVTAGSTVATASGPTNGFIQAATGVQQDAGKEGALGSTYNITTSTASLSTQLTASASVATSVSILATFSLGQVALPLCSPGFISVGFGCASGLAAACPVSTCDPTQVCFNGPSNGTATPVPQCLDQCTLINSFSLPNTVFVNGCNPNGPCPCGTINVPTSTPTQVAATPTPTFNAPTATPTFSAVPTPTLPPPFPTPTGSPVGPTPTPAANCVQPYSSLTGLCVTGTPCLCGQGCAAGAGTGNTTACCGGAQQASGACVQGTSPSTGVFVAPCFCPGSTGGTPLPNSIINCFNKTKFCLGCITPGVLTLTCLPSACFNAAAGLVPNGDMTAIWNCQQGQNGPAYGACLATFWDKAGGPSACPNCTPKTYSTNQADYGGSLGYVPGLPCP